MDDSAIVCDEVIESYNKETKAIPAKQPVKNLPPEDLGSGKYSLTMSFLSTQLSKELS